MHSRERDCCTDDELRSALSANLDGAFEQLVLTYQDRLFGFALGITRSSRDAEEAAQDAFVRAYRALRGYEPERIRELALRPWLYRIALNVCRNRLRGARITEIPLRTPSLDGSDAPEWTDPPDPSEGPERTAERAEERARLGAALSTLPQRYRMPVALRFVEDLSYAEIADALGQPVGTAKANVHRGIKLLRGAIAGEASDE